MVGMGGLSVAPKPAEPSVSSESREQTGFGLSGRCVPFVAYECGIEAVR